MDSKDLQEIAKIFDSIISSPSDAVQSAFKNLVVLASLSQTQEDKGPFETMLERLDSLEYQMRELRREMQIQSNGDYGQFKIDDSVVIDLSNMGADPYASYVGNIDVTSISITGGSSTSYAWDSADTIKVSDLKLKP